MNILDQEGLAFLSRWGHFLAGITWIGLLYYFNFVQVPSFAEFEAATRTDVVRKLVPRALWWFRYGAALTVATGLMILLLQETPAGKSQLFDMDYFKTPPGMSIATGILMALVMFTNVWMFIWPKQRIVIANAERVAAGGQPDPDAVPAGRRALLASRTNTLLSIPMLFFMGATSHFAPLFDPAAGGKRAIYWLVTLAVVAFIEANALGAVGGIGPGPTRRPLETHKDTIIAGLVLALFFILVWEILF